MAWVRKVWGKMKTAPWARALASKADNLLPLPGGEEPTATLYPVRPIDIGTHYKCPHCREKFHTRQGISDHFTRAGKHPEIVKRKFRCSRCWIYFSSKAKLEAHQCVLANYESEKAFVEEKYLEGRKEDAEEHKEELALRASLVFEKKASEICAGEYLLIKERPCKVLEVSTLKYGKRGKPRSKFVAIDIFNGERHEIIAISSEECKVPHVHCTKYLVTEFSEDGSVSLMDETGNYKEEDLKLSDNLLEQIKTGFNKGNDIEVSIISAMGEEKVSGWEEIQKK